MAAEDPHRPAPPSGEHIHMPAPSLLPIINSAALALAIVSVTISITLLILCLVVFAVTTVIWAVQARREFNDLPAEHHGAA